MTINPLRLTVLTPTETIRDVKEVKHAHIHLADGYPIGVYPGHAPLLAETVAAPLRYTDDEGEHTINLTSGILHVEANIIRLLIGKQAIATAEETPDEADTCAPAESPRFERLAQAMLSALHEKT